MYLDGEREYISTPSTNEESFKTCCQPTYSVETYDFDENSDYSGFFFTNLLFTEYYKRIINNHERGVIMKQE